MYAVCNDTKWNEVRGGDALATYRDSSEVAVIVADRFWLRVVRLGLVVPILGGRGLS